MPAATLARALGEIERAGIAVDAVSPFYETAAVGRARQPPYVNAVALVDTSLSPDALLRRLKEIERRAGPPRRQTLGRRAPSTSISSTIRGWCGIGANGRQTSPSGTATAGPAPSAGA